MTVIGLTMYASLTRTTLDRSRRIFRLTANRLQLLPFAAVRQNSDLLVGRCTALRRKIFVGEVTARRTEPWHFDSSASIHGTSRTTRFPLETACPAPGR